MFELLSLGKDLVFGSILAFFLFGISSFVLTAIMFTPYYLYRHFSEFSKVLEGKKRTKSVHLTERAIPVQNVKKNSLHI